MGDVRCAKCGEPWDYYGVNNGDMEPEEARRFKAGKGCPCCGFGTKCPSCAGSGKSSDHARCARCYGRGTMRVWKLCATGHYFNGYQPNTRDLGAKPPAGWIQERVFSAREGLVVEGRATCDAPECDFHSLRVCDDCGGDGKLHRERDAERGIDHDIEAAREECDASDEDPAEILIRRRLL